MLKNLMLATTAFMHSAPDDAGAAPPATTAVAPAGRPKQNGQVRPTPSTLTGLVWDYADAITAKNQAEGKQHYVATIGEVKAYYDKVAGSQVSTCQAQYGRWVKFHAFGDLLKARRAAEKPVPTGQAEKDAVKAAKAAEAAAKKQAKVDEKAAKTAAAAAAKQAKLDEAAAKKQAKADEKAAKTAVAAQAKADKDAATEAAAQAAAAAAAQAAATPPADATVVQPAPMFEEPTT